MQVESPRGQFCNQSKCDSSNDQCCKTMQVALSFGWFCNQCKCRPTGEQIIIIILRSDRWGENCNLCHRQPQAVTVPVQLSKPSWYYHQDSKSLWYHHQNSKSSWYHHQDELDLTTRSNHVFSCTLVDCPTQLIYICICQLILVHLIYQTWIFCKKIGSKSCLK